MKKYILICLLCLSLVGCGQSVNTAATAQNMANPTVVGIMPDGRILKRILIENNNMNYHYVYYFSTNDMQSISLNYIDSKQNRTIVIDGAMFELVPKK